MKRRTLFSSILLLALAAGGAALWHAGQLVGPHGNNVSYGNLHSVPLLVPDEGSQGLVILISDERGIGPQDREWANTLVARGLIVLPVDLAAWRKGLESDPGDCIYAGSDIEGISKEAQRALGLDAYFHPVVAGRGAGGTLAFAAVADSPDATMAGGVALDPAAVLKTVPAICDGATATPASGSGYSYDWQANLPEPFRIFTAGAPAGMPGDEPGKATFTVATDAREREAEATDAVVSIAQQDATALPVIEHRPAGRPVAVALFFSGDGGWRDLDKTIGDWLAENGVEVLGVDSLRYFWSEKSPQEMGSDIGAILDNAMVPAGLPVAVLGYSFGADTLPFAWPDIPATWQKRIGLIGLLAPGRETGFEISIGGWFGLATGAHPVVPAVAALPKDRLLCINGTDDYRDSACTDPALGDVTSLELPGGHHFDGNYDALAARIRAAILAGPQAALQETAIKDARN